MLQISMRQGRKSVVTEKPDKGITIELNQMYLKNDFHPCHKVTLSSDEKKNSINAIMLLKGKTNEETKEEEVKVRLVADDREKGVC